jgi:hypothetical protein
VAPYFGGYVESRGPLYRGHCAVRRECEALRSSANSVRDFRPGCKYSPDPKSKCGKANLSRANLTRALLRVSGPRGKPGTAQADSGGVLTRCEAVENAGRMAALLVQERVRTYWVSFMVKLRRAYGGCLGARRRRRTWQAAISPGEWQAHFDPGMSEWGNPSR